MNVFQTCRNTSDATPLYLPQQLYLKPAARITISIQLPNVKKLQKSISHWEIMEKLRTAITPDEFSVLKVSKTTLEFVRFEAEIENRTRLDRVISKLDNNSIKLKEIPDLIRIKAAEMKSDFPNRRKWDDFFQEAKDMDEMKPGQRPDTVHISHLPVKWFVQYHSRDEDDVVPSEKIFYRIFEKFGPIRFVDIPVCDPYRKKMKEQISGIKTHGFDDKDFFEGYVQFKDYIGFTKAMDALRGMNLLRKDEDEALSVNIKVDFDRSKHLSDASIRRREIVRDRLVKKHREKEEKEKKELEEKKKQELNDRNNEVTKKSEKEKRRREREERRKKRILEKLKINGCEEINQKIAKEEKKLLKAQRKLEAIRLIEELFRRIKEKRVDVPTRSRSRTTTADELQRYKNLSELSVINQRQKLHSAIEGRVVLKSILSRKRSGSRSSSSSASSTSEKTKSKAEIQVPSEIVYDPNWYGYAFPAPIYPPMRGTFMYPRGRGGRMQMAGPSRGRPYRRGRYRGGGYRGYYTPQLEEEYMKYFSKFLPEHDVRRSRSYTRSRSRSRRRSYSRSRSRSRRSRSRSRRRRTRSRSRYTPPRRSRSLTVDTSKFVSPRRRSRSKSWSLPRNERNRRSWSKTPPNK